MHVSLLKPGFLRVSAPLRLIPLFVILFFLIASASVRADPISVIDDRGRGITLAAPAQRIIALAPNITELAFAAGAGAKLAGVSRFSDYPGAAKTIALVGDAARADLERIVEIKPELVIAWKSGNHVSDVEKLERAGLKVFVVELTRLPDIPRVLRVVGALAGTAVEADREAARFERELDALRKVYAKELPVSVFYQIWHEPLMTVNGEHMISDVISLCGGANIFAGLSALTPVVSKESLLAADPQAIIASVSLEKAKTGVEQTWQRYPRLNAVKNHHLFYVHPDLIQRQTPRILQGARLICEQLAKARKGLATPQSAR